jgi:membrane-bound lytic murein transglycosylase D
MVVPLKGVDTASIGKLPIMFAAPVRSRAPVRGVHIVRKGDTLSSIAARYKVTVAELKRWNELGRFLQVGQKVYIRKTVRQ